jgi:hypothetical protein
VIAVALLGASIAVIALRHPDRVTAARSSGPTSTTATATTPPPQPHPTTATSSVAPSSTTTVPGVPWRAVAQAPGMDELSGPTGVVLRVDPTRLSIALVPGTTQPGGTFPEGGAVPIDRRPMLVAATNAGFKRADARGGELVDGHTIGTLVPGAASLVIHADGSVDVGAWGTTVGPSPNNVVVLQNLSLLVDQAQPVPGLDRNIIQNWGVSFHPQLPVSIWRSGVGVDANGRLLYADGPNMVPAQLAHLLVTAGAVRAMELDINHMWVFATLFVHPDPQHPELVQGQPVLPGMTPTPDHVLKPGERDFLAIYRRPGA